MSKNGRCVWSLQEMKEIIAKNPEKNAVQALYDAAREFERDHWDEAYCFNRSGLCDDERCYCHDENDPANRNPNEKEPASRASS